MIVIIELNTGLLKLNSEMRHLKQMVGGYMGKYIQKLFSRLIKLRLKWRVRGFLAKGKEQVSP